MVDEIANVNLENSIIFYSLEQLISKVLNSLSILLFLIVKKI